jgi:hypothetical protein
MMKTEKIRKAKGSVLFTVVAVMTLLVVFMAGTMILVSSANHRSHINYSTAQTTVTSRTVAESVLKAITLEGNDAYVDYFFTVDENNKRIEIPVSIHESTGSDAALGTMGDIDNVVVTYEGKMRFYSDGEKGSEKGWMSRDVIKVVSNVNLGRSNSTTAIYLVVDPPNGDPGTGGGGAGFVTTGGAGLACQSSLYGGAYVNIPELTDDIKNLSKASSTVNYLDPTKSYWEVLRANNPDKKYTLKFGNTGTIIEADCVINGDMDATQNFSGFIMPGKGKGAAVWGNVALNNTDFEIVSHDITGSMNFNEIPYFYVDGTISSGNAMILGDSAENNIAVKSDHPLNVFCGDIQMSGNTFVAIADIYCLDAGKESYIKANPSKLNSWTASVINKTVSYDAETYVGGSFFSKGSLKLGNSLTVGGDMRIEGDLNLDNNSLTVGGDLVVGGNMTGVTLANLHVGGNIYYDGSLGGDSSQLKPGVEIREEIDDTRFTLIENWHANWLEFPFEEGSPWPNWTVEKADDYGNWNITTSNGDVIPLYGGAGKFYAAVDAKKDNVVNGYSPNPGEYYVEVDKDGMTIIGETPTTEASWYYDTTDTSDPPKHWTEEEAKKECTYYYDTVNDKRIPKEEAYSGSQRGIDAYKYTSIYPAYAEKDVILGMRALKDPHSADDLPIAQTQVVKTFENILDSENGIINPYSNRGIPAQFKEDYEDGSLPVFNTDMDIIAKFKEVATNSILDATTEEAAKLKYEASTTLSGAPVITGSCVLDNFSLADVNPYQNSPGIPNKGIVVRPPADGMVIVIKGTFTSCNNFNIIIDDINSSGKVYFYIEDDSTLTFAQNGTLMTAKYNALLNSGQSFQIYTDPSYRKGSYKDVIDEDGKTETVWVNDPPSLDDLGYTAPNVFIYGGSGAKLKFDNFVNVTANIVSPDLYVSAESTNANNKVTKNIVYNGTDLSSNGADTKCYMIGCCNTESAYFKNMIKVLYVPDTGGEGDHYDAADRSHWLKVLYYDEF